MCKLIKMFIRATRFLAPKLLTTQKALTLKLQPKLLLRPHSFSFAAQLGNTSDQSGSKKINVKTLADITGTRYYLHNEEIDFYAEKLVRVYDENEQLVGDFPFGEAFMLAQNNNKDIVLRNAKLDPPICKIMNYKKELLKRLFKKLGKDVS